MTPENLITHERVMALHHASITAHGGTRGVREPGCIERIVGNAYTNAGYESDSGEPDVLGVAAQLLYLFAVNQCLSDGNKRAAWATCLDQLSAYQIDVVATEQEAARFVLDVANKVVSKDQIRPWLAERLSALPAM